MMKHQNKGIGLRSAAILTALILTLTGGCTAQNSGTPDGGTSQSIGTSQSSSAVLSTSDVTTDIQTKEPPAVTEEPGETEGPVIGFSIPLDELSETISFHTFEIDGMTMEIIAAKDSNGTVRTAFNTCQVCNGSRKAYFEISGNDAVCQNCKSRFSISQIGIVSGGCNPYPITADNRVETEDSVQFTYVFLSANKALFTKWKDN
ncbi:MAG: Fe-S-containing protein [Eubacteriales bacterium]